MPFAPAPEPLVAPGEQSLEVVGRGDELAEIERFLAGSAARALVLDGEAGIGKTTLWLAATDAARAQGWEVLRARPAEVENAFAFAGLRDLLRDVPQRLRGRIPEVQRRALAAALAEEEAGAVPVGTGMVGIAVLGLLDALAEERPLLLAIDDLQWLDEESGDVVIYAFRRLAGSARLLVACRGEAHGPLPFGLAHAIGEASLRRLAVGPLSEGAVRRLLRLRLGLELPRRRVHGVYQSSGGNPFLALELGRSGIEADAAGEIRLPRSMQEVVAARLEALPASTRAALAFAAALTEPREDVLGRAGVQVDLDLAPALEAHVLELEDGSLRFTHPLLRSAVWSSVGKVRRREIHRALGEAADSLEERASHLAAAATSPDPEIATLLEEAAAQARARGAPAAAAGFLDRARELAPGDLARWARLAEAAAGAHAEAGHFDNVEEIVLQAQAMLPAGPERAAILVAATEMRPGLDDLLRQAAAEAGDSAVAVRARIGLTAQTALAGRWSEAVEQARETVTLARRHGDRALLGVSLSWLGGLECLDSRPEGERQLARALRVEQELGRRLPTTVYESPQMWTAAARLWNDDPDGARMSLCELLATAAELGDDLSTFQTTRLLVEVELRAGDWPAARDLCRAGLDQVERLGYEYGRPVLLGGLSAVDAWEGRLESARALGTEAATALTAFGDRLWSTHALAALLFTELCAGNAEAALAHAAAIDERFPDGRESWWSYHQADAIEALVLAGRHDAALERADALRRAGAEQRLPRFLAWAERSEGLVRSAEGDLAAAGAALERALAHHDDYPLSFERARTMLEHGNVLRRSRHRHDARIELGAALAEFERLGAAHFALVTRSELQHVGGRAPAGAHQLTRAEDRVARLVASGLSNKDVAAELYVAVSTVEATLTRVYRKLGVRSRSQLASSLAEHPRVG
jgi:DNA-binding CsgD family transcriptional regulator